MTPQQDLPKCLSSRETNLRTTCETGFKGSPFLPIKVMRHEHDSHARIVDELRSRMCGYGPPGDERESWLALCKGVHKFVTDPTEHIHIENNVLFPRFE